jgi:hypothetical protein
MELSTIEGIVRKLLEMVQEIRTYASKTEELKELLYTKVEYASRHLGGHTLRVEVDIGPRCFRRLDEVGKCANTNLTFNKAMLICDYSRCMLSLVSDERTAFTIEDFHSYIQPIYLMTLACNLTPEDIDKIIEGIRNKYEEASKTVELVKQILTMIKILTTGT